MDSKAENSECFKDRVSGRCEESEKRGESEKRHESKGCEHKSTSETASHLMEDFTKLLSTEGTKLFGDILSKLGMEEKFVRDTTESFKSVLSDVTGKFELQELHEDSEGVEGGESRDSDRHEEGRDSERHERSEESKTSAGVEKSKEGENTRTRRPHLHSVFFGTLPRRSSVSRLSVNYVERPESYRVRLSFDVPTIDDVHRIVKSLSNK